MTTSSTPLMSTITTETTNTTTSAPTGARELYLLWLIPLVVVSFLLVLLYRWCRMRLRKRMSEQHGASGQLWTTPSPPMGLSPPGRANDGHLEAIRPPSVGISQPHPAPMNAEPMVDPESAEAIKKRLRGRVQITAVVGRKESTTKINGIAAYYVPSKEAYYIPSINCFYIPSRNTGTPVDYNGPHLGGGSSQPVGVSRPRPAPIAIGHAVGSVQNPAVGPLPPRSNQA
ncbi:uncharacterized protein LOC121386512 isoform X2 [Gigantopelta aegis]|uniref:uncharacterized protein LOC121386512 isoform X2 n=1 Tax=Gigantopelta aegis TaxID=1735272 RepID=UPI001B88DF0E|nr:uncharacterized protein LOC121386512 isoform X2 [Gigantopelta aegis]